MLPSDVERWPAERVLEWLLEQFPGKVALACSFQKEETVLLDMLFALDPQVRVFGIDTHYLFPETYAHWREVEQRYGTTIEVFEGPSPEELAAAHGEMQALRRPADLDVPRQPRRRSHRLPPGSRRAISWRSRSRPSPVRAETRTASG